jgi:hypothetical protein
MNIKQPEIFPSLGNSPSVPEAIGGFGSRYFWVLAVLLVGLFYLLDLWIPAQLAIPICYAAALVLAVALPGKREKIAVAVACTAMLVPTFFSATPTRDCQHGLDWRIKDSPC